MADTHSKYERLIKLIATRKETESNHLAKNLKPSTSDIQDSETQTSQVSDAELRRFVESALQEDKDGKIQKALERDPELFSKLMELQVEMAALESNDTPKDLRERAYASFLEGAESPSKTDGIFRSVMDFLEKTMSRWKPVPLAVAASVAVIIMVAWITTTLQDNEGRENLLVADLRIDQGIKLRGGDIEQTSGLEEPIVISRSQANSSLVTQGTATIPASLLKFFAETAGEITQEDKMRIVTALSQSEPGKLDAGSFHTVVISQAFSLLARETKAAPQVNVNFALFDLSPAEIGLSGSKERGILYLDPVQQLFELR